MLEHILRTINNAGAQSTMNTNKLATNHVILNEFQINPESTMKFSLMLNGILIQMQIYGRVLTDRDNDFLCQLINVGIARNIS